MVRVKLTKKELKDFYEKEGKRYSSQGSSMDPFSDLYLDAAKIGQSQRVLDVGCGDGCLLNRIKDKSSALGIELSNVRAKNAKEKGIEVLVADAEELPIRNAVFDTCFGIELLEHVPDPAQMIRELRRVLKPGGTLLIVVPNDQNCLVYRILAGVPREAFLYRGHLHDFSRLGAIQKMSDGFRIVEVRENKVKPLILMLGLYTLGLYKGFFKGKESLPRRNERAGAKSLIITKFLGLYKKYMPMPKLTLYLIIRLVKNKFNTDGPTEIQRH